MITFDRLRLTLPPGFEHRAEAVSRRVADELAALPALPERRLDRLTVPPLSIEPGAGDREIARRIAREIHRAIGGNTAGGGGPCST